MKQAIDNIPTIEEISPMVRNKDGNEINPFTQDFFNMGESFGKGIIMMYEDHSSKNRNWCIFVDTFTGRRWKLTLRKEK